MVTSPQYELHFVKEGTSQRRGITKGDHPDDLKRIAREARWALGDMKERKGGHWKRHGSWSTGLELWLVYSGDHDPYATPDQRMAFARWGDDDLTPEGEFQMPAEEA